MSPMDSTPRSPKQQFAPLGPRHQKSGRYLRTLLDHPQIVSDCFAPSADVHFTSPSRSGGVSEKTCSAESPRLGSAGRRAKLLIMPSCTQTLTAADDLLRSRKNWLPSTSCPCPCSATGTVPGPVFPLRHHMGNDLVFALTELG
jgi:hypothetical protein